jgi:hypothetical protein
MTRFFGRKEATDTILEKKPRTRFWKRSHGHGFGKEAMDTVLHA